MSKHTFFPYRAGPGELRLQIVPRDGAMQGANGDSIRAFHSDSPEVVVDLQVVVPQELFRAVLPPGEQERPPVEVRIVFHSIEARQRRSMKLDSQSEFRGTITLPRRDWCGRVEFQAFLVRSEPTTQPPAGYAGDRGALLASSQLIDILFDEPSAPPVGGLLKVHWKDFTQAEEAWLRRQADALFALDTAIDPPALYLNSGLEGAQGTLGSAGTHGRKARIRDLAFGVIVHQAWTSLLGGAVSALRDVIRTAEGERPDLAELPSWQAAVIREWVKDLYPECDGEQPALDALYQTLQMSDWTRELLVQRVPQALQQRYHTGRRFSQAATEVWES